MASMGLDKHDIHAQLMRSEHLHVLVSRLPSLNDCVVTKQNVLRLFSFKFCHILSTACFINEDNSYYCHSQRIGQLIKEKLFKVDQLINVAANTQISPSLLLTSAICKQMINFFLHECFLEFFFFPKSCLFVGGAAYTRVRLIHESLR